MPIRVRKKINGKWQPSGSYLVEIVTKTVGRIVKATGAFPTTKNGREKLEQIKLGNVKLLDALAPYQSGRMNAVEAYAGDAFVPAMANWLQDDSSPQARTR